jgi:hypothetical protein
MTSFMSVRYNIAVFDSAVFVPYGWSKNYNFDIVLNQPVIEGAIAKLTLHYKQIPTRTLCYIAIECRTLKICREMIRFCVPCLEDTEEVADGRTIRVYKPKNMCALLNEVFGHTLISTSDWMKLITFDFGLRRSGLLKELFQSFEKTLYRPRILLNNPNECIIRNKRSVRRVEDIVRSVARHYNAKHADYMMDDDVFGRPCSINEFKIEDTLMDDYHKITYKDLPCEVRWLLAS